LNGDDITDNIFNISTVGGKDLLTDFFCTDFFDNGVGKYGSRDN
jgi:hypothetical protein